MAQWLSGSVTQRFDSPVDPAGLVQDNKAALMNVFSQTDGGLMLTFPGNCSFSQNPPRLCISAQGHRGYLLCARKAAVL